MEDINKEFLELLDDIRKRPEEYLGRKSLILLNSFFHGYYDGLYYVKDWSITYFCGLHEWTAARYEGPATIGWARMITYSERCEVKAFDRFFELLEEFVEETRPVIGRKTISTSSELPYDIRRLMEMIRIRPALFTGRQSLKLLDAFVRGYTVAYNRYSDEPLDYFEGFQEWIEERYHMKPDDHSWAEIILFYESYDFRAFETFFEHFDNFRKYKRIKGERSELGRKGSIDIGSE